MKKTLALLVALIFAASTPAMAAGVALSDEEMDGIAAGAWEVIDPTIEEVVEGLHFSNNDIKLNDDSQRDIQAVSNANVVDSAVAVQTNISNVDSVLGTAQNSVEGHNTANIANYNPSIEEKTWDNKWTSDSLTETINKSDVADEKIWKSSSFDSSYTYNESDIIDEDLVIAAALVAVGETEGKNNESEFALAAAFALGYTFDETYSKNVTKTAGGSHQFEKVWHSTSTVDKSTIDTHVEDKEKGSYKRKNLSENNHIDLEDQSQQAIQAVSNLNAVGSGTAIQTNLANNVGDGHSIIHTNTATVINGL